MIENSTNPRVLPASLQIPKFIIAIGKIIESISSYLATKFAIWLFTTPVDYPKPKREKLMYKSAQKKQLFVKEINKEIHVLSYGYSKKKVLLAHGWAGRSTQLFMVADKLLEKGYMVISFDGPAHGKSSGKRTNMVEYITTIDAIVNEFGPFEAAVGHSFGAMALLNVASTKNYFKKLVTVGAADLVTGILCRFIKNLKMSSRIATKMEAHFNKGWQIKIDDFASNNAAKNVKIPVLVVHDTSDGDVPVSCAFKIRQNLKKGSILITRGLGHTKILRDNITMQRVANFIIHE